MVVLKDTKLARRLVVSSHVPTLKHKAKKGYITHKRLFQLLYETNKQLSLVIYPCSALSFSVCT